MLPHLAAEGQMVYLFYKKKIEEETHPLDVIFLKMKDLRPGFVAHQLCYKPVHPKSLLVACFMTLVAPEKVVCRISPWFRRRLWSGLLGGQICIAYILVLFEAS
uniref:Uncharacterized protein n=1 Tax=Arundo donax TaxID=35708 RepID=A0A0A9A5I2_ARUDO